REARGAETHRGSGELESTAGDATGDLRNAVPAVAEALEDRVEIGEEVHVRRRARAELLPERELARRASEVALPDRRQARAIRPARQSFDGVHDHERLDEVRAERVAGAPCTGDRDRSLELLARDVPIREAPRRAPPANDFLDRQAGERRGRRVRDRAGSGAPRDHLVRRGERREAAAGLEQCAPQVAPTERSQPVIVCAVVVKARREVAALRGREIDLHVVERAGAGRRSEAIALAGWTKAPAEHAVRVA